MIQVKSHGGDAGSCEGISDLNPTEGNDKVTPSWK